MVTRWTKATFPQSGGRRTADHVGSMLLTVLSGILEPVGGAVGRVKKQVQFGDVKVIRKPKKKKKKKKTFQRQLS